jgi:hypothetical protein
MNTAKNVSLGCAAAIVMVVALVVFYAAFVAWHYGRRAATVVKDETDPAVLQARYSWFKDAAAQLDKKVADIEVYEKRASVMKDSYEGAPRSQWAREDREQSNVWEQEVAGVKASYNTLAAEYNAAMAKWNWRFCNVGTLPPGATEPLPREFKPYVGG